jgi:hypothetical protein
LTHRRHLLIGAIVCALHPLLPPQPERFRRPRWSPITLLQASTNQRSQPSLRKISNPPIPAVQISLQALSESLQFLWRLDARGDHIPKLIALAREDILTQCVVLEFVSCRLS